MTYVYVPPSPKAQGYLLALARDRRCPELGATADERVATLTERLRERMLDRYDATRLIDVLKASPFDDADVQVGVGVYRLDETIYVVRSNRTNGGVHARRLQEIGGRRLTETDERVRFDFVYDAEVLPKLRPEHQMTLDEARPFIVRYGRCIACGTHLVDATSVERGIGPVCVKKFAPSLLVRPAPQLPARTLALLAAARGEA